MNYAYTSIKSIDRDENIFSCVNDLSLIKDRNKFPRDLVYKNNKKVKIRNSGIDLIRILDMFSIIIHHIILHGGLFKKYYKYKELILINILCSWHITCFILISGIVGYKTCKYSNLLYLWFCVLFYSVGIPLFIMIFKPQFKTKDNFVFNFFPMIFYKYWYFSKYFGLYLLLPVINKGIESLNQYELKIVFISILNIYIIWNYALNPGNDIFNINNGKSIVYFLTMYITGSYLGKYLIDKKYKGIKR